MSILSNKKSLLLLGFLAVSIVVWLAWRNFFDSKTTRRKTDPAVAVMLDWHVYGLVAERFTEGYRVPVSARVYAYIGLAGWEAALPALPGEWQSMAHHFPGLQLPTPEPGANYHLPTVLNACYGVVFKKFYLAAPRNIEQERRILEEKWTRQALLEIDSQTWQRSAEFGAKVAEAVYEWSATDSLGHMANLHNYDRSYTLTSGAGAWKPCEDFPMPALLPHWGNTRTFIINPEKYIASPLPPFSTEPQSIYYAQALEIYTVNSPLSPENQWVAEFWGDDLPGLTFSSAARWISISNQVIEQEALAPEKALETYLRVGFAISDAAVSCWKSKYTYNLLRPETYIRQVFQADWRPIVHTPSFPAYPSGHAMLSAAAAEVLTNLYGQQYEMTDNSHKGRTEFKGKPRHFHSFYEMAFESASSRIPMGAHFRIDCDEGTRLGLMIGKEVTGLPLRKGEKPL